MLLLRVFLCFAVIAGVVVGLYKGIKYIVESRAKVAKAHVEKFHDDEEKYADKRIKQIKRGK